MCEKMEKSLSKQEFTARQKQVLSLVRKGFTNVEICKALNISANTVKVHLAKIYKIMKVNNRTEAASVEYEEADDCVKKIPQVRILVTKKNDFKNSQMDKFFFLLDQNLHRFRLFDVRNEPIESETSEFSYQIVFSGSENPSSSVYLSLYSSEKKDFLWAYSQRLDESSDIDFICSQITKLLYRQMLNSAALDFGKGESVLPSWWLVSAFVNYKMDCRCKESFSRCECEVLSLLQKGLGNSFLKFSLVRLYYTAITESWVKPQKYFSQIQDLAYSAMREEPYSDYARLMMALYDILAGNKKEAITYLTLVIEANPQNVWARIILAQVYLLMGDNVKAFELFKDHERFFSDLANDPMQIIAKAFIYFLQKKYDECEKYALQVSYMRPESLYPLLFLIVCSLVKGDVNAVQEYKEMMFQYHPNFKISNCFTLLKGVDPEQFKTIESLLNKAFDESNTKK